MRMPPPPPGMMPVRVPMMRPPMRPPAGFMPPPPSGRPAAPGSIHYPSQDPSRMGSIPKPSEEAPAKSTEWSTGRYISELLMIDAELDGYGYLCEWLQWYFDCNWAQLLELKILPLSMGAIYMQFVLHVLPPCHVVLVQLNHKLYNLHLSQLIF